MKIFSHVAMLLAFFASNMAMWGQISRTVSFDLNSRQETNYCLGANTSEFTLTIDTKLESIDSLKAYDVALRYDASKIRILAASRIGTISRNLDDENFFFKNPENGLTEVSGYTGLSKNSPNLIGEGALFALRGLWINSKCADSTTISVEYLDPGFEFGIGPRYVKVDSSVQLSNRMIDTIQTSIRIQGIKQVFDTVAKDQKVYTISLTREVFFGRATGNDTITLKTLYSDKVKVIKYMIDSSNNVSGFINNDNITFRKIAIGNLGYARVKFDLEISTLEDTTIHEISTFSKSTKCDCAVKMDSISTSIMLMRNFDPDTIISSVKDEDGENNQCTEFYDILGRFIESDCPNNESAKAIKRKRAFKLGNDYIQYIDSK